jgi:hypothetical protein
MSKHLRRRFHDMFLSSACTCLTMAAYAVTIVVMPGTLLAGSTELDGYTGSDHDDAAVTSYQTAGSRQLQDLVQAGCWLCQHPHLACQPAVRAEQRRLLGGWRQASRVSGPPCSKRPPAAASDLGQILSQTYPRTLDVPDLFKAGDVAIRRAWRRTTFLAVHCQNVDVDMQRNRQMIRASGVTSARRARLWPAN